MGSAMAVTIDIEASTAGPAARFVASGRLLDACDDARAPVETSCRAASCGLCLVEVKAGAALLEPPAADESALLERLAAQSGHRLACQAVVRAGEGVVHLRWVGPARRALGDPDAG
jgi:adenylate cyclase